MRTSLGIVVMAVMAVMAVGAVGCGGRTEPATPATTTSGVGPLGNGQSDAGATPAATSMPVCTYSESGLEYTIAVRVDRAKSRYHLSGAVLGSDITCPVGEDNPSVFEYAVARYDTLLVQTENGLIRFGYLNRPSDGPGYGYWSLCTVDGIQITQRYKDAALYVRFTREDGSGYRADISPYWDPGVISFYPMDSDATTALGTRLATVSSSNGTTAVSFVDLDNRQVTIHLTEYHRIVSVTATHP